MKYMPSINPIEEDESEHKKDLNHQTTLQKNIDQNSKKR
jgi:hypothetical protein